MTSITWPEGIPYSDLNWSSKSNSNNIVFTPERGNSKIRRTSTRPTELLDVSITLTAYQFQLFMHWHNYDLNYGSSSFMYPDFIYNGEAREARFIASPSVTRNDEHTVRINLNMEFLP